MLEYNIYLDFSARFNQILLLKNQISKEKIIIEKDIVENKIPIDFKKYNALFDYHKIRPTKDDNQGIISCTYEENKEKINTEKLTAWFLSSFMYKIDINCIEALERYKTRDEHEKKILMY